MSRSRRREIDAGDAISIESALTIMVVLILIRLLFFIPLVNIDRAHLEKAQKDTYWKKLAVWIQQQPQTDDARPYIHAFSLDGSRICVTNAGDREYIEALSPTGEISVIMHRGESFISIVNRDQSNAVTYQFGDIHWSAAEREWFTANTTIDYGENARATDMQKAYREWTKENRGF